jgi:hypothetical protein
VSENTNHSEKSFFALCLLLFPAIGASLAQGSDYDSPRTSRSFIGRVGMAHTFPWRNKQAFRPMLCS